MSRNNGKLSAPSPRLFKFVAPTKMVKHLPPAIKHLLSLRNPNSHLSPPLLKLHGILDSTLTDAKQRKAENGWLVLTVCENTDIPNLQLTLRPYSQTCTLLTANIPSSVGHLYRF